MKQVYKCLSVALTAFIVIINTFFCFSVTVMAEENNDNDWPTAPEVVAQNAILIDADTGAILYQKEAHTRSYPASTTKILTGLLTIENCSMDEIVTFSATAANSVTYEDANIATKTGEEYTVEQALYGLLLRSANEIGYGLAEHVSGSLSSFTDLMNERAKELGAINTHFSNASGLHDDNHYTTAYDMAMIARGCYNNSTFVNIDSTSTTYTIPATNKTPTERYIKHLHLMLKGRDYYYEYCKGGKTGFTDQAGYNLVTFAEKNDMRLICVCFKSGKNERFQYTRALFDWGFNNFKKITTTSDTVNSLFTNDSYYQSKVYNNYGLNFNLNASTLTIPNNKNIGDIYIDIDKNYATSNENGIYTSQLNFMCSDNIVGTTKITLSSDDNIVAASNLPLINPNKSTPAPSPKQCIVINIWLLTAILISIIVIIYVIVIIKRVRKAKKQRSRKLRL